jgi:magnesium transporter
MARLIKKRAQKAGLPPGTLVYTGEKSDRKPQITIIEYDEHAYGEKDLAAITECLILKDKPGVTWINVVGIHDLANVENLGDCLNLHPLVLEDILSTDQRPKLEDFGDYIYLVLKSLKYGDETDEIDAQQISLIIGANYVLSFCEGNEDLFQPVALRIRNNLGRIRRSGADYLAYALMDLIVDNYFVILERLGETIEFLEEALVTRPLPATLQSIHKLKLDMLILRKSIWPLREVISKLQRRESPLIKEPTGIYLKDVYDHAIQVIETIETYRDMLSGMVDIYLSSMSNRLNEVMKVLTIIATIFIPLTWIAGVYGMNFKNMPELEWRYGYLVIMVSMVSIALVMLIFFKKKKWLGK